MKILLHPKLWISFIENNGKLIRSKEDNALVNIVTNSKNVFGYHHEWEKFYIDHFQKVQSSEYDYEDVFNQYIIELHYHDRLYHENQGKPKEDIDYIDIFKASGVANCVLISSSKDLGGSTHKKGIGIFDKISQPNRHWILISLACCNGNSSYTLYHSDFRSNEQVQNFIRDLFEFSNPSENRIFIQSDYMNFGHLFNKIKGKKITYCSSSYESGTKKTSQKLKNDVNRVKNHFGNKASLIVSGNKKITHSRSVLYSNIIAELNHDFDQIDIANSNWQITFQYNENSYTKRRNIVKKYSKVS